MFSNKKLKTRIGLDINDESIRLLEIEYSGPHYKIANVFKALLPEGTIIHGDIKNPKLVIQELKKLKISLKNGNKVAISLPNHLITQRNLALENQLNEAEQEALVEHELKQQFIQLNESLNFDFTTSHPNSLLITAAQTKYINNKIDVLNASELMPFIVDVTDFAIARAILELEPVKIINDLIGVLTVEKNYITLMVLDHEKIIYSKHKYFRERSSKDSLISIMLQLLIFFTSNITNKKISKLILAGSLGNQKSLVKQINAATNINTQAASVIKHIEASEKLDPAFLTSIDSELLLCYGLASHSHWDL